MALTWGGPYITEELWSYIYNVTGVWPSQTSCVYGSSSITSTSYVTKLDISSGPYMLVGVGNLPSGTGDIDVRITIDGGTPVEFTGLSPTGDNYAVGLFFNTMKDVAPLLARSSIKIEAKRASGTQYLNWVYAGYTLS
jgi:hypothetical protein